MTVSSAVTNVLVIGGGPAGLSTALTLARTLRSVTIYDSGEYRNARASHSHTIPGFDGKDAADWRSAARADLGKYHNVERHHGQIVSLERLAGGSVSDPTPTRFRATDDEGKVIECRKVVLATGLQDVLPDIPGLAQQWGKRAIHCIFCHGTETAHGAMGFLITPQQAALNPMIVGGALTMWPTLDHSRKVFLTHGLDPDVEADLKTSGLEPHLKILKARGFEIISDPIAQVEEHKDGLHFTFTTDREPLVLPYLMVMPEKSHPPASVASFLTPSFLHAPLDPGGTVPPVPADAPPAHMPPRSGADPRTPARGVFWAGNAGSAAANVSMSVGHGQVCGVVVAGELGGEDLAAEAAALASE